MDKIVFITGAGFSRPHGLPLMSDFYEMSRELYHLNPDKYTHFDEVFRIIRDIHIIKSYYSSDLFNIEEILSILEMWQEAGGKQLKKPFTKYIEDVITSYTKNLNTPSHFKNGWWDYIFPQEGKWTLYGFFALHFFPIMIHLNKKGSNQDPNLSVEVSVNNQSGHREISLITLNYDRILELACESFVSRFMQYNGQINIGFSRKKDEDANLPYYAKLHGSIGEDNIVPPTWNKGINDGIKESWELAYDLLLEASKIIILGYSLPKTDSYIRYLLKASVIYNTNLKNIDVITLDSDGSTKKRYTDTILFKNFRFVNQDIENYLKVLVNPQIAQISNDRYSENMILQFRNIDSRHEAFMKNHQS